MYPLGSKLNVSSGTFVQVFAVKLNAALRYAREGGGAVAGVYVNPVGKSLEVGATIQATPEEWATSEVPSCARTIVAVVAPAV
jgi:hypothetical protein